MGKHERQEIEEAEKIIVKVLNSQALNSSERRNRWFKHAISIAKEIQKDFSWLRRAHHLGNRYDNVGDILIISNHRKSFIEVKMSDTKSGVGTKANISQDALTENYLFVGQIQSWSEFRDGEKHDQWVNDYLNRFKAYPDSILGIPSFIAQREEKARYLRDLSERGNKKALSILRAIQARDKQEKLEYLGYLRRQEQRGEMIKRFLIFIVSGIHKKGRLKALRRSGKFLREAQNLFVYYSNISKGRVVVRRENVGNKLRKLLSRFSEFKIVFPPGVTYCKIVGVTNKLQQPLLQIVLHWKNIAQGIKTPCLNIFDLTP